MSASHALPTKAVLQAQADRWCEKLKTLGYRLPSTRITVYTSPGKFEDAVGVPYEGEPVDGLAASSRDGDPIVYVKVSPEFTYDDTIVMLIHELLHHVSPRLPHDDVYRLARELRVDIDARIRELPFSVADGEQFLQDLWLEANGFPKEDDEDDLVEVHPRSALSGRFVRAQTEKSGKEGSAARRARDTIAIVTGAQPRDEEATAWRTSS